MKRCVSAAVLLLCIMFAIVPAGLIHAAPLAQSNTPLGNATFSNLSWCFLNNQGDSVALGGRDTFLVHATLTNNTTYKTGFRIGVRLVSGYNTSTPKDHTYGGPTYLYGKGQSKNEKTNAAIQDLNLLGATGTNTDIRESFGEVQNLAPIAHGASGSFSAVLGIGSLDKDTNLRVELHAFDQRTGTYQAAVAGGSIPYNNTRPGCLSLSGATQNVGTGFTLADTVRGTIKYTGGWINVSKPAYEPTDSAMVVEFTMLSTNTPTYEHDFDSGANAFSLEIVDKSTNTVAATVTGSSSTKEGCNYTTSVTRPGGGSGNASLLCRVMTYYAAGQTPASTGYTYSIASFGTGSGWPTTHIVSIPFGASNPWLIPGRVYDVRLKSGSGSGSHYMAADSSDSFLYSATPTAVKLISFSGSPNGGQPVALLGLWLLAALGLWAGASRLKGDKSA